jgi:hypothetical protein
MGQAGKAFKKVLETYDCHSFFTIGNMCKLVVNGSLVGRERPVDHRPEG